MLERVIADPGRFRVRVIFFYLQLCLLRGAELSGHRLDRIVGFHGFVRGRRAFVLSSGLEMQGRLYSLSRSYACAYTVSIQIEEKCARE